MSRFLLARHGQSVSNAVRRFQGVQDVALSELGARQAEALGQAIRRLRIAAVYTSPLERARRTAEIAAAGLGVPLKLVDDLRELSLGEWEGRTVEEIRALPGDPYERWVRDPVACLPPGGEPLPEVQARVVSAMAGIAAAHPNGQQVLVVEVARPGDDRQHPPAHDDRVAEVLPVAGNLPQVLAAASQGDLLPAQRQELG